MSYSIKPDQKEKFLKDGFLLLPKAIPTDLLKQWQGLTDELNNRVEHNFQKQGQSQNMHIVEAGDKNILTRCNNLLSIYPDAVLDLLASPVMLTIAKELCGQGAVPLQCDALFKHHHGDSAILWHQDALHNRCFPYLNIGVYLDDAEAGDGCLKYVPGTQHEAQDIGGLVRSHGWKIPGAVDQPAKAGDILVQDMMVLHGSPIKRREGVRRTVYVEMRPFAAIIDQGYQSREWAELRMRWMGLVKRRVASNAWPTELNEIPEDLKSDADEIAAILNRREPPVPAIYSIGKG